MHMGQLWPIRPELIPVSIGSINTIFTFTFTGRVTLQRYPEQLKGVTSQYFELF